MTDDLQTVPDEHLRAFHHVERNHFQRFISELSIQPLEAMDIIFLWFMLERTTAPPSSSTSSASTARLSSIVEEARICMAVVLYGPVTMTAPSSDQSIVITKSALGGKLTLTHLHEMRERILRGMNRYVETIASRIFGDIVARDTGSNEAAAHVRDVANNYASPANSAMPTSASGAADAPTMGDPTSTFGARRPAVSHSVPKQAFQMPARGLG